MTFSLDHIHPMTVHFPVAVIILGFLAEILSLIYKNHDWLKKISFYMLLIGSLAAVTGYLTGEFFTEELRGAAGELKEKHEIFAKITMYIMIAASAIRIFQMFKKNENALFKWFVFALYAIAFISVGITGYLGGSLVYDFMISL